MHIHGIVILVVKQVVFPLSLGLIRLLRCRVVVIMNFEVVLTNDAFLTIAIAAYPLLLMSASAADSDNTITFRWSSEGYGSILAIIATV